ncbi:MAG: hypothetical protein ACRDJV_00640 [Actinomycetota bacterium]
MLPLFGSPPADLLFAHPVTQSFALPFSPLVAAVAGSFAVFMVALVWPSRDEREPRSEPQLTSWAGRLSLPQIATRAAAVLVLALAIAAGRLGSDDQLENLAPALIVGAVWPLLVLISTVVGPVWRWTDPWDGVARPFAPGDTDRSPGNVWPAVVAALVWVWYLSAYPDALEPGSVGAILALYTVATVAGCLAMGRVRWLASSEPLGIVLSWMARVSRRRLADWQPPAGAESLLGVLAGGVLFGAVRRSELWGDLNADPNSLLWATVGVVGAGLIVAGLLEGMARAAERGRSGVARGAVPAVAGIVVAVALDFNRLFTSVQLLPGLLGDPFGEGWDLLGRAGAGLDPAPLGVDGLLWAQLGVLLAGHLAGAVVVARGLPPGDRAPGAAVLAVLTAASVIAVITH